MASLPPLPKNAPFNAEDLAFLNQLVQRSTPLQRSWLSGFLAGLDASQASTSANPQVVQASRPRIPLTILYGSESGNAEALAFKAKKVAAKQNCDVKVLDMSDVTPEAIVKSQNLLVFISTWGEGDPPQRASEFYKALMDVSAPKLEGLRFAVLSLGDTAYVNFCETGKKIDERLETLGATRIADRIDLDLDFAKGAALWTEKTLEKISPLDNTTTATVVHVDFKGAGFEDETNEPLYTAENPCEAEVSALVNLNGTGSTRETWHVELSIGVEGFTYEPGAAIGIFPENDATLASDVARAVGLDGDKNFIAKLIKSYDITTLSRSIVGSYAKLTGRKDVTNLLEGENFSEFNIDRQFIDFLQAYPEKLSQDQLLSLLRPLPGRLYSVASSMKAHPSEA
ncbi:MAG: flavodoxin domain-containing protein, partial [Hyphomicrobium sp.]